MSGFGFMNIIVVPEHHLSCFFPSSIRKQEIQDMHCEKQSTNNIRDKINKYTNKIIALTGRYFVNQKK